jgi:hypothetical protein
MDEGEKVLALNKFIAREEGFMKLSLIAALAAFFLGLGASVTILWLTLLAIDPESVDASQKTVAATEKFISAIPVLGGTLLTTLFGKFYFSKRGLIDRCEILLEAFKKPPVSEKIDERFWKVFDKYIDKGE